MLPETKLRQYGLPNMEVRGIVIHNTNAPNMSADDLYRYIEKVSTGSNGCHYIVDHKKVRKVMPEDWCCFNTGMGMDFGNTQCIAVEICTHLNTNLYLQGQTRAIGLIRDIMKRHNLTKKDIYFHRDFNRHINCPAQILAIYKTKAEFLKLI